MDLKSAAAGLAIGAALVGGVVVATQHIQTRTVSQLEIAGDVGAMAAAPGDFVSYAFGGPNWAKRAFVESAADTMVLAYFPAKYTLGWEPLLGDAEAQRVLACNFVGCLFTPVNGVSSPVRAVWPVPHRTDVLGIDTADNEPRLVHRSRWDKVVTIGAGE